MRDLDPRKWLATLTREVADENLDDGTRQMAGIIFKNFIMNRSNDATYQDYWI